MSSLLLFSFLVPEISADVYEQFTGEMQKKIEMVITKLLISPCPNSKVSNESVLIIIDHFWKEF